MPITVKPKKANESRRNFYSRSEGYRKVVILEVIGAIEDKLKK